jgi:hypothetical protein
MKKLLFLSILATSLVANASHLFGGYIQAVQRGYSDTVDITVILFSDPQGLPSPSSITITEWKSINNFYQQNSTITLASQGSSTWQGVNVTKYSIYKVLPAGSYRFIYTNCCRSFHTNASSSPNSNITIGLDYKKTAPGTFKNSAPLIANFLPIKWVVGDTTTSILFATDFDGDSVRVVMDDAINQHANNTFVPLAPFTQLNNYGYYNVQGNGSITWAPNIVGQFATGYKIEEYRNGDLIGVNRVQQIYLAVTGTTPSVPWPPVLIQHDLLNGDSVTVNIPSTNATSTSLIFPKVDVTQTSLTSWNLVNLQHGVYKGVLRVSNNLSNNDYFLTLRVVSTIGIEELTVTPTYEVFDWYGRSLGKNIMWSELKGLYVVKYSNGKIEKIYVNGQ